ncbi:MAG: tRNA uracil 4-sulfurtransferase ThiI [Anaerovoracaceae bacterium]
MQEKNTFIVRCGEVALKGMNKPYFERMLVERIRKVLKKYGSGIEVKRQEGLIFVYAPQELGVDGVIADISKVFGVASVSHALETASDMEAIGKAAGEYMLDLMQKRNFTTFKVEAKRADKSFPLESPRIAKEIGGSVLKACKVLKVDVHHPEAVLYVNVRKTGTFIYADKIKGFGGLPLGTNGKGLILLSGGIDSPVAAWMMAKRGMLIEAVHFHSYPYTSERAREKVHDLARIIAGYCGRIKVHSINLLEIQQAIGENCPEDEMTILSRRFMMMIAERVAVRNGCDMLITGENIGQVASQTVQGLVVTDNAVQMPVMRPLIALDKVDIMEIAQKIGTFETSIQPFEDCCTVFLPKHPVTKPKLERILESESKLDVEGLIQSALQTRDTVVIEPEL